MRGWEMGEGKMVPWAASAKALTGHMPRGPQKRGAAHSAPV